MEKVELLSESSQLYQIMFMLVDIAKASTCKRSKCGSVIVSPAPQCNIIGVGYNAMPCNEVGECFKDSLPKDFKSDKTCCVHAEQRAILNALKKGYDVKGSTLYFIRLDENNNQIPAGDPYCTICSKMALDVGISRFVLWRKEGWTSYDTKYYNELSFQYKNDK